MLPSQSGRSLSGASGRHGTPFSFPSLQRLDLLPPIAPDSSGGAQQIAEDESRCAEQEHDVQRASPWTRVNCAAVHIKDLLLYGDSAVVPRVASGMPCRSAARDLVTPACRLRAFDSYERYGEG